MISHNLKSQAVEHRYSSRTMTRTDPVAEAENSRRAATSPRFWFVPTQESTAEIYPQISGLRTSPCRLGTPCLSLFPQTNLSSYLNKFRFILLSEPLSLSCLKIASREEKVGFFYFTLFFFCPKILDFYRFGLNSILKTNQFD